MKKFIFTLLFSALFLFGQNSSSSSMPPNVWWVDMHNGNDSNDGTTAAKAFKTIHKVLESNSYLTSGQVDTVKVMPSVNNDNPNGYYDFKNDELYTYNSRDFVLIGVEGAGKTIFDAQSTNRHMTIDDGQSNKTKFIGLTFQNGLAENWPGAGAIFLSNGSDVQFIDCIFKNNKTTYNEGGGAIIAREGSTPSFTSCTFDNNGVEVSSTGSSGGAVNIQWPTSKDDLNEAIIFRNSTFLNNYVKTDYNAYGGAIKSERSMTIENCLFVNNYVLSNIDGTYNHTSGGAVFWNAVYWNNNSQNYDGGTMTIANSTFHGNYVSSNTKEIGDWEIYGGTIAYGDYYGESNSKAYIFNSSITGSRVLAGGEKFIYSNTDNEKRAVIGAGNTSGYKLTMDYSIVQAPREGSGWGDYIYNVTPAFKDTSNGDYSLSDKSPLIGAGVATWDDEGISAPTSDINAKYDHAFNITTTSVRPNPAGSNPDIGAYENSLATSSAPMPVSGFVATAASSGIKMSWSKNKESLGSTTDASDIEYQIYQDGTNVAQTTDNSATISGLTNGTEYTFSISAKNTSTGTESALSPSVVIKPRHSGPWYVATSGGKALSDTSSNYNYGSKDSPINHLSNAMEIAATGDTIIMMKGTHSGSNNRGITPSDKKQLVITGDLAYDPDQTVINASGKDRHFKFSNSGIDTNYVIQNITLYNGLVEGSTDGGGSVYINQGMPKFHKVIFHSNVDSTQYWRGAGAIAVSDQGSVIIDSCVFDGNRRSMYSTNSSDNENYNNYAQGGAISLDNAQSRSTIRKSTFKNNKAYAKYDARGSAIYINSTAVDIINNLFYNNETRSGLGSTNPASSIGVIYYENGPMEYKANNWTATTSVLVNNTIVNNLSSSGYSNSWLVSGVYYCSHDQGGDNPSVYAFNNIIYGNKNLNGSTWVTEEYQLQLHCGEPVFRNDYNLIYNLDNLKNGGGGSGSNYFNFDYSLDVDPGFKDSTLGDFNLSDASLAIGAGIANWSDWDKNAPLSDILGGDRPNPSGSSPDLGAYENALGSSPYPGQVKNVVAFGGSGEITLSWDAVSSAAKYNVYIHTSAFNVESTYYVGEATESTYTITGLDNTTRYFLRVTAVNADGYEGTASSSIDITPKFSGPVYWMATDGLDTNEGSSAKPFKSLRYALDMISGGDTLMIKEGTYTGSENREIMIDTYNLTDQDKYKNVVIASEKGPEATIFDAGGNGRHLEIRTSGEHPIDSTFQIIGLTFQNGKTSGDWGGSVRINTGVENVGSENYAHHAQVKFKNCIFINNKAGGGGAMSIHLAAPIIENCVFENNLAEQTGGAIVFQGENNSTIIEDTLWVRNSIFKNNRVDSPNGDGPSGGAISLFHNGNVVIIKSTFENNQAVSSSDGHGSYGGALFMTREHKNNGTNYSPLVYIVKSRFSKNKVDWLGGNTNSHGGAIYANAPFAMWNSVIDSNEARFSSDNGRGIGGGIHIVIGNHNNSPTHWLFNNTIVNNVASSQTSMGVGAGIFLNNPQDQRGVWFNNIFFGNKNYDNNNNIGGFGAVGIDNGQSFQIINDYNSFEGVFDQTDLSFGENTFDLNPGFVGTSNYALSDASPVIGLGTLSFDGVSAPSADYLSNKRPNPVGSNPDLGAYENALAVSPYPTQVQNFVGQPSSGQVTLNWDALAATNIEHYEVYMSTSPNIETKSENYVDQTSTTSLVVTGLDNNQEYFFKVAGVDSDGYLGAFSKELMIIPAYSGPNWWISMNGNDEFGDGSQENPFQSLVWPFMHVKSNTPNGEGNPPFSFFNDGDTIRLMQSNNPYHTGSFPIKISSNNDQDAAIEVAGMNYGAQLTNFTIMGDSNDPNDAKIQGTGFGTFHLSGIDATFKNLVIENGSSEEENSAAILMVDGELIVENSIVRNHYSNGSGGAIGLNNSSALIKNSLFKENSARYNAGAININNDYSGGEEVPVKIEIINTVFQGNRVNGSDQTGSAHGGAIRVWPNKGLDLSIVQSTFFQNKVYAYKDGIGAVGGAIAVAYRGTFDYSNIIPIKIDASIFKNNRSEVLNDNMWMGAAVLIGWPTHITNSLFDGNFIQNKGSNGGGQTAVSYNFGDNVQGQLDNVFANNTVVNNYFSNSNSGTNNHSPIVFWHSNATVINNVVWDNPNGFVYFGEDDVKLNNHNNLENWDQNGTGYGPQTFSHDPKFKNVNNDNYQLSSNSLLIDAGTQEADGYLAPVTDLRGFFRVGKPDIGAFEVGASKYLLVLEDDIEGGEVITLDGGTIVPVVKLEEEITFKVLTNDINGDIISSNEQISWNVFPNQKYITFLSGDNNTEGGDAEATFKITDEDKGKGFRFRIEVGVGEASIRSQMYVIEEIAKGSPPPVLDLTITPSGWSNDPNFTLEWNTPTWKLDDGSQGRELIGAVAEVTDGVINYNQFLQFPTGDTLTSFNFSLPEAGEFHTEVWLVDEYGNEDQDSAKSAKAYFDNIPPDNFNLYFPRSIEEIIYTSDKPSFVWEERGDYPSGIKEWRIIVNNNIYGTYNVNDVTFDNGDIYIDGDVALPDGYYDWWIEAVDMAENITNSSDTANFGVDLSPPNINHPSPLITIDENTTSPSINASFSDGASGVNFGRLHYRRAGSGGGFVTVDLLAGPANIPGSDIKKDGLEYYIDTEDNVGNYGYWPQDKAFQSVKVRSEEAISTASQWASGVPGQGTDSTNYWFFSIPFDVGNAKNVITSVMGQSDGFNYRLYGYNNGWQENPGSVSMGNGYFFIYDPSKYEDILPIRFDFGQGVSTATDPPFKVSVSPGNWKFIGSPYNFNVPLSNIYTEDGSSLNDAGSIYSWNGSWGSAGSTMQPWKGYIFKSGGATELHIDARGSGFGKMAKSVANGDDIPMNGEEWIIDIIATTGEARDEMNAVGVRHMAKDGYDRFDEFEPPVVPGNLTVRVDNRKREVSPDLYAKDIRKPNETGHYWDLQVFAPTNGLRTYLTFEGLGYIPQEYDVFLINKTTKQAKNLEWESSYRFANTGSENYLKQDFRLVVGTKKFVEDNNAGVNLYPDAFTLAQNYPNPFNPQTSIMISLEEDAQVDLIIYNLLGEEITRLAANERRPAGYYNFIWNGRNDMGTKVSTGVYFYHALIRNEQGKVVLNKTRKMIFLK